MLKAKPKCLQLFVPSVSTQVCQGVSLRTSWTICSGALCKGWVSFFIGCGFLTINIHGRWLGFLILKLHFLRNINSLRNFCSFYHVASMTGGGSSWEHMLWMFMTYFLEGHALVCWRLASMARFSTSKLRQTLPGCSQWNGWGEAELTLLPAFAPNTFSPKQSSAMSEIICELKLAVSNFTQMKQVWPAVVFVHLYTCRGLLCDSLGHQETIWKICFSQLIKLASESGIFWWAWSKVESSCLFACIGKGKHTTSHFALYIMHVVHIVYCLYHTQRVDTCTIIYIYIYTTLHYISYDIVYLI